MSDDYMGESIWDECRHTRQDIVRRECSNGTAQYVYQCARCGRVASGCISHREVKDKEAVPAMNHDIGRAYQAAREPVMEEHRAMASEASRVVRESCRAARKEEYERFLCSDMWKRKRARRMELNRSLFGGLCEFCMERPAAECHHLTYRHRGAEFAFELACVCRECHMRETELQRIFDMAWEDPTCS